MKPGLRDVTLSATDCLCPALAARALRESLSACDFGDAVLLTDAPIEDPAFRVVPIPTLDSIDSYSRFILKSLVEHISTPYVLITQWDGYVIDAAAWMPEFLQVDYIGAPWFWYNDGMKVGNGGFSLRSRRFLEATAADRFAFMHGTPEDHQACRYHRKALVEELGIRFAPEVLASRFSYERSLPARSTFGFHGVFNLWRHVEDAQMIGLAGSLPVKVARRPELVELMVQYVGQRRFRVFDAVYRRARAVRPMAELQADARRIVHDERFLVLFDASCERAEGLEA